MIEIEIDGSKVEVQEGSMIMDAAQKLGTYVPHFCYHKKLSIAANCRMCLVEVEKAPKPLPACATPVTAGMVVKTKSPKAVTAQKGVMEFLLINHPLDCPICDQGGECQLQDLAVGYGDSASRYQEEKRVVFNKNLGPLIATDMTRCIHCTRCVRFGQEIAGVMELGMLNRGEHSEIITFVGQTVDSELSGNMIDLCPVGALTSKPFRYSARTWELGRKRSISPHDSVGANQIVQTKNNKVFRVVPFENDAINECWLSDKDRFAYEGLNAEDRVQLPLIKQDGVWSEVSWEQALSVLAEKLSRVKEKYGPDQVAALVNPVSTLEELFLTQKIVRSLGSDNIDFRLHQSDFSVHPSEGGIPSLGMPIAELSRLQRVLVVGVNLRKDHPLMAQRIRQACKRGAKVAVLHGADHDQLMPIQTKSLLPPSKWVEELCGIAKAIAQSKQLALLGCEEVVVSEFARATADLLLTGERKALLLGNAAAWHVSYSQISALMSWIAQQTGAAFGHLTESANTVGAYIAKALSSDPNKNYLEQITTGKKAFFLLNVEPELDVAHPALMTKALTSADLVVALSPYKNGIQNYADMILPIAPYTETSGTFINCEGTVQSFNGVVPPLGESRPGWKVLRVIANILGLANFDYATSEEVRDEALKDYSLSKLSAKSINELPRLGSESHASAGLELLPYVPLYATDAIVRRAKSLQKTVDAKSAGIKLSAKALQSLGLESGDMVRITISGLVLTGHCYADNALSDEVVMVPFGHVVSQFMPSMSGLLKVEAL